jgi:FixJ family two-component response regulator
MICQISDLREFRETFGRACGGVGRPAPNVPVQPKTNESMDESPRISIVDDDASVRRALGWLCKSAGYAVVSFASAEDFLEAATGDETDCLILDVHLPGRSGLQLQTDLLAADKRFPIVFVTAYEDDQARTQALEGGAVEFLRKPLDSERLLDVIQRALSQ